MQFEAIVAQAALCQQISFLILSTYIPCRQQGYQKSVLFFFWTSSFLCCPGYAPICVWGFVLRFEFCIYSDKRLDVKETTVWKELYTPSYNVKLPHNKVELQCLFSLLFWKQMTHVCLYPSSSPLSVRHERKFFTKPVQGKLVTCMKRFQVFKSKTKPLRFGLRES